MTDKAAASPAAKAYISMLHNLLAVIHRDGGHYVEQHGLEQAYEDGMQIVAAALAPSQATPVAQPIASLRWQPDGRHEVMWHDTPISGWVTCYTSPVPAPTQETPERRVLENLRLYVAAEGHDERGKFIGLSWRGYDQWGPILRGKDDPFGFVEDVEKWLHEKIDAALASDAPVLYDEEVIQARNRDPAQPATDERIADQLESLLVDVTVLNPEEAAIVRRAAALLREQSKDARRYRWLRVQRHADIAACWYLPAHCDPAAFDTPEKRDEAIDCAIEQRPESGT